MLSEDLLIKSLKYIAGFPENIYGSADEYLKIHHRNINELQLLAEKRRSAQIPKLVNQFESITKTEINDFIDWKKNDVSLFEASVGRITGTVLKFIRNKGNTRSMIKKKLENIAAISINIAQIVENPYYEEMYK